MTIDLLKTYPFGVRFHQKGEFNLLQWYTHNDGNHIILGKDETSICKTFQSILKKYPDAEAKEHYRINVVSLSESLELRYAQHIFWTERLNFRWRFAGPLRTYREMGRKLPRLISLCKNPRDEDGKVIQKESDYDSGHSMCVNCIDGFLVKGYTYDSLFERLRAKVFAEEVNSEKRKRSEAPRPTPKRVLYVVTEQPGNHRKGTAVDRVENWESLGEKDHFPTTVHFFFQGERLKIPATVIAAIRAGEDAWKDRKKKDKEEQKIRNQEHKDYLIKQVDTLLEGL